MLSNKPLFIEFIGLPGSGKTTICQHINDNNEYGWYNIKINTGDYINNYYKYKFKNKLYAFDIYKLITIIYETIININCIDRLIRIGLASGFTDKRARLKHLSRIVHTIHINKDIINKSTNREVIIYDQGILQRVGAINIPSKTFVKNDYTNIISCIYSKNNFGMVHVDSSLELSIKRIRDRADGLSRIEKWEYSKAAYNLAIMDKVFRELIVNVKSMGIPVLKLSANESPEKNSIIVQKWISSIYK